VTTILIADANDVVRSGLRALLSKHEHWRVIAEAAHGKEAVRQVVATWPDVAIIGHSPPDLNGVEVARQIRQCAPGTEVIISATHYRHPAHELLRSGALGFLLKSDANRLLLTAIETVAEHKPFFTGAVSETLLQFFLTNANNKPLTARERCVVRLIAEGHRNRDIASILNLSVKTVETHRAAVQRKLNIHSTAELVRYAIRNHITQK
jgi:DNA-binding NarL/FixJ family response regulator